MGKESLKLIAYCGLYCPKCYKMVVSQKAKALKDALENTHICGSVNEPRKEFKEELNKLAGLRCPKLCKDGGGNPNCLIRKCCIEKNFAGCWQCHDFLECNNLKKQFVDNLKKIKEMGIEDFILLMKGP
jgi:hypothetical protein